MVSKNINEAYLMSILPGLGHVYLGLYRFAFFYLAGDIAIILHFIIPSVMIGTDTTVNGIYVLTLSALLYLSLSIASMIDITYIFKKINCIYFKISYGLTLIIPTLICIIISIIIFFEEAYPKYVIPILGLWVIILIVELYYLKSIAKKSTNMVY